MKYNIFVTLFYFICGGLSFLSIFAQKYLRKCEDTYFILRNKYLHMYEDNFGVKMLLKNKIQKYYISKLLLENYLIYI